MGTMIYGKGVYINQCYDELNLSRPELVSEIHRAYVKAGAEILETNTFGANRYKLDGYGLGEQVQIINYRAVKLAREAARDDVFVAGAIGPLGLRIEPFGPTSADEAKEAFKEQAQALLEGGADLIVIETFSDLAEILQAIRAVKELGDVPVVAQMTVQTDGLSSYGTEPELIAKRLDEWGADVIGLNCSVGPQIMLEAIEKMAPATKARLSAQPNAGLPRAVHGRSMYFSAPEYFGKYARRFIQAGVKFVGGCCGTTPEHIHEIVNAVRALSPRQPRFNVRVSEEQKQAVEQVARADKSRFAKKISGRQFVTSVEIVPPKGCDPKEIVQSARLLREAGVDAVNIPDGPRATSRMGALPLAVILEQQVGIEPVLHYCCRDRNLLSMQSDLLGAYALGLRNILIITGDPPKMGPYPSATAVFDVDSIGLTNLVRMLNSGFDVGGNPIGQPTGWHIGVGCNPGAVELDNEVKRFEWKVDAGAEFAITQPVFDTAQLREFLRRIEHCRIPVIAGIWPLTSLRNAEFMNNEVPGITVPVAVMERMRKAEGKEAARQEGIQIAREMLLEVREHVQGAQVSAPFGRVQYSLDVLQILG